METKRFDELEGLRGYLALWVAFGHAWQMTVWKPGNTLFALLNSNAAAVHAFMILSGFVITNLLIERRETYASYITRRFFRLYPTFILCTILGFLTYDMFVEYLRSVSWTNEALPAWQIYKVDRIDRGDLMHESIWSHIIAHVTMLHGVIPYEMLPHAAIALLGPAWSISLEWQFYLMPR